MPDAKRKKNDAPDSLTVRDGRDGPDQVYVQVPNGFEDAQAALKAAGAEKAGWGWVMTRAAFAEAEDAIREAARADIALGPYGRKARREAGREEREAQAAFWEQVRAHRALFREGEAQAGQIIDTPHGPKPISVVGRVIEVSEKSLERLNEAWGPGDLAVGDKVSWAYYDPPAA